MTIAGPRLAVAMVRPPQALVNRGLTDLRADPDEDSERVDQAHYGERLTLLTREDDWFYAQGPDHFFGWVQADHLDEVTAARKPVLRFVPGVAGAE